MFTLTPPLSVNITPLIPAGGAAIKRTIDQIANRDIHCIHLSAATKGLRPRELDKSARRDLLATLTRKSIMLSSIDLLIPNEHWNDNKQVDRALSSTISAIHLAADLGRVPLSINLPIDLITNEIKHELITAADGHSTPLAIHIADQSESLHPWLKNLDHPMIGASIDPAIQLQIKNDPVNILSNFANHLFLARLDDLAISGQRCNIGSGRLDLLAYKIALGTLEKLKAIVLELRELPDPTEGLNIGIELWENQPKTGF